MKFIQKTILMLALLVSSYAQCATINDPIVIWGTPVSPFVRKVLTVAEAKGVSYSHNQTLPKVLLDATNQPIPEGFLQASPLGKIPAMTQGDFFLADSAVIAVYLDKLSKENSVYPTCPKKLARSLWFEKYADTRMTEVLTQIFVEKFVKKVVLSQDANPEVVQALYKQLPEILSYLESQIDSNSKYLVGEQFTIGDIAVGHQFYGFEMAGIDWDKTGHPKLSAYLSRVYQHPSFAKVIAKS